MFYVFIFLFLGNVANGMEPTFSAEVVEPIIAKLPINHPFRHQSWQKLTMSPAESDDIAEQFYTISQSKLEKCNNDRTLQKNYLQKAMMLGNSWSEDKKKYLDQALAKFIEKRYLNKLTESSLNKYIFFENNYLMVLQHSGNLVRFPVTTTLTLEQKKLFLCALEYIDITVLKDMNHNFALESVTPFYLPNSNFLNIKKSFKEQLQYQKIDAITSLGATPVFTKAFFDGLSFFTSYIDVPNKWKKRKLNTDIVKN